MIDFLTIVLIIFGVLQIILFFKMWGMTNNVKEIKKIYFEELEIRKKEIHKKEEVQPASPRSEPKQNIEKKNTLQIPPHEPVGKISEEEFHVPIQELKHYDIDEKDINKFKVLKKRGFTEQAINEFIKISSADREDAITFINSL